MIAFLSKYSSSIIVSVSAVASAVALFLCLSDSYNRKEQNISLERTVCP